MDSKSVTQLNFANLFPSPIGVMEIGRDFTDEEMQFALSQKMRRNIGNETSEDSYVFGSAALADIYRIAKNSLDVYFESVYKPKFDVGLKITQSWFNFTRKGQFHHNHTHDNSFISGVIYFETDENSDRIYFQNPNKRELKVEPSEFNQYNSPNWWMPTKKGTIILFPSNISHSVANVENDSTRISLAFNSFPIGTMGDAKTLTEVKL
jgi:uncharacterized protein (TIGR02466 family)